MMKRNKALLVLFVLLYAMAALTSCAAQSTVVSAAPMLKVHFIDVGQGDCTFIELPDGRTILIDGGNKPDADTIMAYLKSENVKTIDYLIATHPHEDHIGSLPAIVKAYKIGSIYMPKAAANTKIYEDLLSAIKTKGYKINTAAAGVKIIDTKDLKLSLLAPVSTRYQELNNYSAVAKLIYLNTSFLFTGDAEDVSEKEMLSKGYDLKTDLIKIGHHGGRTSSTQTFLSAVASKYAVISVGKGNDYGHPHQETMTKLNNMKVKIYRTDELGTIVASSDGASIMMSKSPAAIKTTETTASNFYIGNKNSKIFHLPTCSSLPNPENQVKFKLRADAVKEGFKPCQRCKP